MPSVNWLQRLLALLAGLISAAVGVILLAAAAGWVPGEWEIRPLDFLLRSWRLHLWGIGLASFVIGLATLIGTGGRERRERPVVRETELGTVAISRRAVEKLVATAAQRIAGVREVRVGLDQNQEGLTVSLTLKVDPDVPLHGVSHDVQTEVERYLRETTDLTARRVNVEIEQVVEPGSSGRNGRQEPARHPSYSFREDNDR